MTSPEQNGEIDFFNNDDAFNTYINVDFLKNDIMDEDMETGTMSSSDLFRYYLEGEMVNKDSENNEENESPLSSTIADGQNDFTLAVSPTLSAADYTKYNLPITPITPITPATDISDLQQQSLTNATVPSLAVLNAQLAELLAKLPLIKQETADNKVNVSLPALSTHKAEPSKSSMAATKSFSMDSISNDDMAGDLKKMSSKERRQLRNKISARNFRVRRKEYIQNLESTNQEQQKEINMLKQALVVLQEENSKLTQEVEQLRKVSCQPSVVKSPPSPPPTSASTVQSKDNSIHTRGKPQPHQSPSPNYLIPNVNKDAPATASKSQPKWQGAGVRVQTAFIPELHFDKHMFEPKATYTDNFWYRTSIGGYNRDIINTLDTEMLQQAMLVFTVYCTLAQRMTTMFTEAVCAIPPNDMAVLLYPELAIEKKIFKSEVAIEDKESIDAKPDMKTAVSSEVIDELSHAVVDSSTEASVLDWLYENMVRSVIEQSQLEARVMELNSDWVSDEWDDTVLPHLF
ncbi:1754_t:CDS:2 [Paraglomus brasilianum]|uniref:1754_t:CDS:1 n=1 Tax=Paraglomus brasilianum TaxID=144538 RepID=A0A9N9AZA8_9GLOM|nr:1754_t:CDS:2 [Paraglomus brasilianum]